jgi:viroplasmin and RNaseH domain-containing protein
MPYVFEVQRFYYELNNTYNEVLPKSWCVGYVNKVFETREEAGEYYDESNPHMRPLNQYNTWISGFDPETSLGYILKEYSNQDLLLSMTKC